MTVLHRQAPAAAAAVAVHRGARPAAARRCAPAHRRPGRRHDGGRVPGRGARACGPPASARRGRWQALGYRQLGQHLDGALPLAEAVEQTKRATVAYARRQRTWFRKEPAAMRVAGAARRWIARWPRVAVADLAPGCASLRGLAWPTADRDRRCSTSSARWWSSSARSTSCGSSPRARRSWQREIQTLETRVEELQREIFADLTPWQTVLLSRHPGRPYTLDYLAAADHRLHRAARRSPLRRRPGHRRRAWAGSRARRCCASATRRGAPPRRTSAATSGCPSPRATARRCA